MRWKAFHFQDNFPHLVKKPVQALAGRMYSLLRTRKSKFQGWNMIWQQTWVLWLIWKRSIIIWYSMTAKYNTRAKWHQQNAELVVSERKRRTVFYEKLSVHLDSTKAQKKAPNAPKLAPGAIKCTMRFVLSPAFKHTCYCACTTSSYILCSPMTNLYRWKFLPQSQKCLRDLCLSCDLWIDDLCQVLNYSSNILLMPKYLI